MAEERCRVSVVVCTYNRAESLSRCLESVMHQETGGTFTYEVVVVDDGSTDHTAKVVVQTQAAGGAPVRYVRNWEGGGVAAARNLGVEAASGGWVAFCDDDQRAAPDWLKELLRVGWERGARCVGGGIRADLPEDVRARHGRICMDLLGEHAYEGAPFVFAGHDLPSTGNLLVAKEVFDEVGGFDTGTDSGEDTEFLARVQRAGIAVWAAPASLVCHQVPEYRLGPKYLRWVSRRWGVHFALVDARHRGCRATVLRGIARLGQAGVIFLPRACWAWLRHDRAALCDQFCLLWRTEGYVRKCLSLCAPVLLAQPRFFAALRFRAERRLFTPELGPPRRPGVA